MLNLSFKYITHAKQSSTQTLLNILMLCRIANIDYADPYFQLSQDESWVLEDGIIKEGGFHIDRRCVRQFLARKQALLMPI